MHDGSGYRTSTIYTNVTSIKYGLSYDPLGISAIKDGGVISSSTFDGNINLGANIELGSGGGVKSWGSIAKFKYYPARMSNTQLQLMTQ